MSAPTDWNAVIGYAPVRRRGPLVVVSGATGMSGPDAQDIFTETSTALERMLERLASVGGTPSDLVGVRIHLRDIEDWLAAGQAHANLLGHVGVALTMVGAALVDSRMRVEVDGTAWIEAAAPGSDGRLHSSEEGSVR